MAEEKNVDIQNLEQKIDAIYQSVEKTRVYFKWTLIVSIIMIVLPIIGSILAVPVLLSVLNGFSPSP